MEAWAVDLVAIDVHGFPLFPVGGAVEARHDAMLPGPVVDVVQVFIEDISKFYISEKWILPRVGNF